MFNGISLLWLQISLNTMRALGIVLLTACQSFFSWLHSLPLCVCSLVFNNRLKRNSCRFLELFLCVVPSPLVFSSTNSSKVHLPKLWSLTLEFHETIIVWLEFSPLYHSTKSSSGQKAKLSSASFYLFSFSFFHLFCAFSSHAIKRKQE